MVILPRVPFWNNEIPETSLPILFCFRMYFIYLLDINTSDNSPFWSVKREIGTLLNAGNKCNMIAVSSSAHDMDIVAIRESNNGFSNTPFIIYHCFMFIVSSSVYFTDWSVWIPRGNANVFGPITCCISSKIHHLYKMFMYQVVRVWLDDSLAIYFYSKATQKIPPRSMFL